MVYLRLSVAQDNEKKYQAALESANKAAQYAQEGTCRKEPRHAAARLDCRSCYWTTTRQRPRRRNLRRRRATPLRLTEELAGSHDIHEGGRNRSNGAGRRLRTPVPEPRPVSSRRSPIRRLHAKRSRRCHPGPSSPYRETTSNWNSSATPFFRLSSARTCFSQFPEYAEGDLSKLRAHIVSARALIRPARNLEIGKYLRLGRGEEKKRWPCQERPAGKCARSLDRCAVPRCGLRECPPICCKRNPSTCASRIAGGRQATCRSRTTSRRYKSWFMPPAVRSPGTPW